jgi:HPt (histidine-containing phosphotransfer) domain-containing protein
MSNLDLFDRAGALSFLGDEALLAEVLDAFVKSSQGQLQLFRQAIAVGDADAARRYLHRVTPTLGILAVKPLLAEANEVRAMWRDIQADIAIRGQRSHALADSLDRLIAQVESSHSTRPRTS